MEIFYDSEGRIFTQTETAYDSGSNKISERRSGRGIPQAYRMVYEYDASDRLIDTVRYNEEDNMQSQTSSVYNREGELVETASYNPDGSLINKTNFVYVYDEIGNWTEKKKLVRNNARETYYVTDEIIFRTFTY